jgi:small subunit ribosomal protein S17
MSTTTKVRALTGRVTSDKRKNTITVKVEWSRLHPVYGKVLRRFTTCHAHDENEIAKLGDLVEIKEVRPISKTKTWQLVRVVEGSSQ